MLITEEKGQPLLAPNIVILNHITHYLVTHPNNGCEARKLVIARGTCNGVPFEATTINDPDFSTTLDFVPNDNRKFSKWEFSSGPRTDKNGKTNGNILTRGVKEENKGGMDPF